MEAHKIIITGAATRMGAAIAKKLSGPGIEIVIHYNKSKANAENLKKKLIFYEVPISYKGRSYEEGKKITLKDAFVALFCIFKYRFFN